MLSEQDLKNNAYLQSILQATNKNYRPSLRQFVGGAIKDGSKAIVKGVKDRALAFGAGMGDNYQAYSASVNKGLSKVADAIGWDSGKRYFDEGVALANLARNRLQNTIADTGHEYYGLAGQILGDPVNFAPAGILAKGGKVAHKTLKSGVAGVGMGSGTSLLRDYGDDSVSGSDMLKHAMLGGVLWGGMNTALASSAVDTLARKAVGKIAPNAKFADINARNARWATEQAQMNANPTAWYNREVAVPFAQDFRNLQAKFRPQQTTGNQVLDSVLAMTNQPKPQTFSQSIATRPLMGENPINISPEHARAKAREALDNQYNQMLMSKLPQQDPYYLSPNRPQPNTARPMMPQQPINNPNLANPNMKAGFTTNTIPNLLANTAYYGGAGAIGAYNSDNPYLGFAGGVATAYGLKHGGKRAINTFKNRPLGDTKNAFNNGYVNLSYETRMSDKSPTFKNAYNMLGDRKTAEQFDIAVHSDKDVKKIMDNLGLRYKDIGIKDGMYEGVSNPSRQLQIKPEFDGNGNLTQDFINRVNLASAMLGKGFKQDAVAWHLPKKLDLEKATPEQLRSANGLKLSLNEPINAEVLGKFDKAFGSRYGLIPDPDGKSVRIIDFETEINGKAKDFTNFPNDVRNLLKQSGYNTKNLKGERFTIANGDYIGNNHKVLKSQTNGEKDILFYDRKGYDDTINNLSSNIYSTDNSVGNIFGKIAKAKKRFTETIDGATPTTDRWVLPTSQQMERNFGRRERELVERQTRNGAGLAQGQGSVVRTGQDLRRVVGDLSPQQSQTQQSLQGILPQDGRGFSKGFITPNLASHIATSGTGALIGASQDSENRLRGAAIGAIGGIGANKFIKLGAKAFAKNQANETKQSLQEIVKNSPNFKKGIINNIDLTQKAPKNGKMPLNGDAIDDIVNKKASQQPQKQVLTEAQKQEIYKRYGTKKGNEILNNIAKNQIATFATGSMVGMSALPSDGSFSDRLRNATIGGLGFVGARNIGKMSRALQKSNLEKVEAKFGKNSDEYLNALQKYEQDGASSGFKDISQSNNFLVNTFRDFRRYFSNTMSKEVNDLKDVVATRTNATSQRISQLEKGLRVNFDEAERKEMGKWLMGDESVDFSQFNPQTQKFLQDIKNEINANNQKLVELEHIDQKTADEFKDIYLTRRYENDTASKVNDFFNSNYGVSEIKQRGKSEWVSLNEFEQMKADGKIAEYGDGGFSRGGKYVVDSKPEIKAVRDENGNIVLQERIKIRRDYTPQEREAMGEITDIAELLPKTLYKQNETIAHIEYLNALKTYGKGLQNDHAARQLFLDTSKFAKGTDIDKIAEQQGFKKVNNKHFGALNGEYVRKDVYDDLVNTYDRIANAIFGKDGSAIRNYKELVQSWKKSKTVYNPKAHLNNIVSNEMLMVQYGLKPAGVSYFDKIASVDKYQILKTKAQFGKIKYDEIKELSRLSKELKTYDEAMELGLFGRGEIQDLQGDMIEGAINKTIGKIHKGTADKWNSINKSMENWYQKEDHICRLSAYEQLKAKTLKGENRPLTQAEKQDIRKQVMAIFPDYTEAMPKGIKALRDTGAVPFISWSYYVLPKMVKQMNTPKGAAALAGILGTYYAGMSLMREFQDIEVGDDISDNAGKYMPLPKNIGKILRQDDNDDLVTRVKVDRAIPQLEFTRSPANMVGSMLKSPLVQSVNDVINISTGRHPVQLFNNMPITRDSKSLPNRIYDYAKYGVNTYMPLPSYLQGIYNVGENRLMPQEKRRTNNVYVPRSFLQEVLNLVGVNTSNYSKTGARQEAERRRQRNN